jgi:WD40 repeat protein
MMMMKLRARILIIIALALVVATAIAGGTLVTKRLLRARRAGKLERTLAAPGTRIRCVAFSPDGALVAAGADDGSVRIWSSESGALLHTLGTRSDARMVTALAFSPRGDRLAAGLLHGRIAIYAMPGGGLEREIGNVQTTSELAFSPRGDLVAVASGPGASVFSVRDGAPVLALAGMPRSISFSPVSDLVATTESVSLFLTFHSLRDGAVVRRTKLRSSDCAVAFSPAGDLIATLNPDGAALRRVADGAVAFELGRRGDHGRPYAMQFDQLGETIAVLEADHVLYIYSARTGALARALPIEWDELWDVGDAFAFSPEGARLAASGDVVRIWDLALDR